MTARARRKVDIESVLKQDGVILDAIRRGVREAMKQYIFAGESMVSWKDGKVVYIPPEELKKILAEEEAEAALA